MRFLRQKPVYSPVSNVSIVTCLLVDGSFVVVLLCLPSLIKSSASFAYGIYLAFKNLYLEVSSISSHRKQICMGCVRNAFLITSLKIYI